MASHCSLHSANHFSFLKSFGSKIKRDKGDPPKLLKLEQKELGDFLQSKRSASLQLLPANYTSSRCVSLRATSTAASEETNDGTSPTLVEAENDEMEFNRVNCLVWVLHESAASFSQAIQSLQLPGSSAELAMAWNGKDVHEWHRNIAYQVAVYALLKMAIEVEVLLSLDRQNNASPVKEILTRDVNMLGEYIESVLKLKHVELVQWFREVEFPRIAGFFIPLLKKWSMEYAGSGVAGIIVAISCCAAVHKLGPGRISCPKCTLSIEDVLVELMDLSHSSVEVNKLHKLATEAGFEHDFLFHFGGKVFPCNEIEELEFWIGLALQKLSAAFYIESLDVRTENSRHKVTSPVLNTPLRNMARKVICHPELSKISISPLNLAKVHQFACLNARCQLFVGLTFQRFHISDFSFSNQDMARGNEGVESLATLGLFAYLGRKTRLFLSKMGVRDLDELVKDFLNYLECGILFTYPELGSVSTYECFMEIVTDEIGWLDFYGAYFPVSSKERKRSKQYPIQAEKDIILSTVFTVCYDTFSGFAHFIRSTQQPLKSESLEFLLRSQSLLTVCLEDYQAVYARSCASQLISEAGTSKSSVALEVQKKARVGDKEVKLKEELDGGSKATNSISFVEATSISAESSSKNSNLIRNYRVKLASTSSDLLMGTRLLFEDIINALELVLKRMKGHKVTRREKRKLKRTMSDIATLIPITILMLVPVSAVGHAAMLAAIKKYVPQLIPSPFSSERLAVAKQLERTKKMEIRTWSNLQDQPSRINFNDPASIISFDDQSSNPVVQ